MTRVAILYFGWLTCFGLGQKITSTTSGDKLGMGSTDSGQYIFTSDRYLGSRSISLANHSIDDCKERLNETLRGNCCADLLREYKEALIANWYRLSKLMQRLKAWKCPQFKSECLSRTFAFTEFTRLLYDRFCNETVYLTKCNTDLQKVINHRNYPKNHTKNGTVYNKIRHTILTLDEMLIPCVQVALIDVNNVEKDDYFEIKENQPPMCEFVWCGFTEDAFTRYDISEWICMPRSCRINIIIIMVIAALLSLVVTTANITVLFVFANNYRLRDSQGVYKMSLAVADALVGMFVFPAVIETMRRAYQGRYSITHGLDGVDGASLQVESFSKTYRNFVGFFNTLTLTASIYILMVASFDRFMVVFHPLRYNLYTAKSLAMKLSIAIWLLALLFCVIPFMVPQLDYVKLTLIVISFGGSGDGEVAMLTAAFIVPLALVWVVNIATFAYSKKNAKARPKVINPESRKVRSINVENRLAKTLFIMVGVFTVCLLPLTAVIVAHIFLEGINPHVPENLNPDRLTIISSMELISCILLLSNSLWNFFIYNVRSFEFRKACLGLFRNAKVNLKSRFYRDSAKEARNRRASAIPSHSSQIQSFNATVVNL